MDRTGWEEALRRIDAEREARTGTLDLAGLGLRALTPAIGELTWLRALDLGARTSRDQPIFRPNLSHFREIPGPGVRSNPLVDLAPLATLTALSRLDLSGTSVGDLMPLRGLESLVDLDLGGSLVRNLAGIEGMKRLRVLRLDRSTVDDLGSIPRRGALRTLDCSDTPLADLGPVAELKALVELHCAETVVSDLLPLASLDTLRVLDCSHTPVTDLRPLERAGDLRRLTCRSTPISDLGPLGSAASLTSLDIAGSGVTDLGPLATLTRLRLLRCSGCDLSDLAALAGHVDMRELDCSFTAVSDLRPVSGMRALGVLSVGHSPVADLAPLVGCRVLEFLDCASTEVRDLGPLAGLSSLKSINCSQTRVSDLSPLEGSRGLLAVNCRATDVSRLDPLLEFGALRLVLAGECPIVEVPKRLIMRPSLRRFTIGPGAGLPPELLGRSVLDNCLPRLRAHIADLQAGAEPYRTTKVIVLGNGRVGKTQLCRKLRGLDYDPAISSTHGIVIDTADFDDGETLNLWDFGGQDIYHGAHALFMRTRAVFVIAWHPDFEESPTHEHQGMTFRNRPLAYWLAFVQAMSAKGSPVIVVQARCDSRRQVVKRPPIPEAFLDEMDCRIVQYSAETDFGRRRLDAEIADAIDAIRERDGIASIGAGRARVIDALQAQREADRLRPAAERESRVLDMRRFVAICDAAGGVSSPKMLLHYLHQCGLLFYDPKRFGDRILLDISWALEAIYTLFDRETAWRQLQGSDGRFSAALLAATVWRDVDPEARALFVSLMESCGICFRHGRHGQGIEPEYVAPDLLPERARIARHLQGRMVGARRRLVQRYAFLHPGLFRGLMARVGGRAGDAGVYWQRGLWVYVPRSDTQVQVEVFPDAGEGYGGRIQMAMIGADGELADWLREQLAELSRRFGLMALSPEVDELPVGPMREPEPIDAEAGPLEEVREPAFGRIPPEAIKRPDPGRPRVYISYARREGATLTKALHGALTAAGLDVIYDEVGAGYGDSIGAFMDALIEGDRVIVLLGEHYLRSPYCMYELYGIWQRARSDPRRFADKVLPLLLPGTQIDTVPARLGHARYWRTHFEVTQALVGVDPAAIAAGDLVDFKHMQSYYLHVGDMLRALADTLMPRDLEALAAEGFAPLLALLGAQPAR